MLDACERADGAAAGVQPRSWRLGDPDSLDRADQLVFPYKPRIIVYYCGSNDVGGGEPAGAIIGRTKQFLKIAGERLPDTFVYYTAIQKAPDKRDRWDVVETVNREMERYSHQATNLGFIDLNPVLFDKKGNVRMERPA